jgi:hypothetical protein
LRKPPQLQQFFPRFYQSFLPCFRNFEVQN